jgi:hypothetical protein
MQAVLRAAKDRTIPYVGAAAPEKVDGPADWHRVLDLLDETAGSKTADGLFRQWVVTAADLATLDTRATARTGYQVLVDAGQGWLPPPFVRVPMSAWDFSEAGRRIPLASAVLGVRDQISALVAPIGIDPPADLRSAYESAGNTMAEAQALAESELQAAHALVTAEAAAGRPRDLVTAIGLMGGETPDAALAAARSAFQAGAADAGTRAEQVTTQIGAAPAVGRGRIVAGVGTLIVIVFLLVVAVVLVRRRRAVPRLLQAHPVDDDVPIAPISYATLPDQSARATGIETTAPDDAPPDPSREPATDPPKENDVT